MVLPSDIDSTGQKPAPLPEFTDRPAHKGYCGEPRVAPFNPFPFSHSLKEWYGEEHPVPFPLGRDSVMGMPDSDPVGDFLNDECNCSACRAAAPTPPSPCPLAPAGWRCTREAGHEGPCAAVGIPLTPEQVETFKEERERRAAECSDPLGHLTDMGPDYWDAVEYSTANDLVPAIVLAIVVIAIVGACIWMGGRPW